MIFRKAGGTRASSRWGLNCLRNFWESARLDRWALEHRQRHRLAGRNLQVEGVGHLRVSQAGLHLRADLVVLGAEHVDGRGTRGIPLRAGDQRPVLVADARRAGGALDHLDRAADVAHVADVRVDLAAGGVLEDVDPAAVTQLGVHVDAAGNLQAVGVPGAHLDFPVVLAGPAGLAPEEVRVVDVQHHAAVIGVIAAVVHLPTVADVPAEARAVVDGPLKAGVPAWLEVDALLVLRRRKRRAAHVMHAIASRTVLCVFMPGLFQKRSQSARLAYSSPRVPYPPRGREACPRRVCR